MTEPRQIAVVRAEQGYDGLHRALRARADELQLSRNTIDELASLTRGHAGKLLAPYPVRAIGRTTLGPLLYALRLKIVLIQDDEIVWDEEVDQKNASYDRSTSSPSIGLANAPEIRALSKQLVADEMKERQRNGGRKRARSLTRKERKKLARKAWRTRRRRAREQRSTTRCAPGPDPKQRSRNEASPQSCQAPTRLGISVGSARAATRSKKQPN